MSERPKVFISYSHDSEEHTDRVQKLADRLRQDGVACEIDQYEPFPPEGWPAWMGRQLDEADFVLVACTRTYFQRLTEDERPGVGLGARFEGRLIEQYLYDAKGQNQKFIPILFDGQDEKWIPKTLRRYTRYQVDTEKGYTALFRYLTKQPAKVKPPVGSLWRLSPDELTDVVEVPEEDAAKRGAALLSSIGRVLWRRWQWSVAVALMLGAGVYCWLWWTAHQRAQLYDRGRQAMAGLDFQEAQMLFEEAGANHDPVVRSALAEALMNLGQNDRAGQEAESALNQSKKLPYQDRLLVEARYHRIRDNWSEALVRYQKLHEREPAEVEYAVGIAETQIALDRPEKALSLIEKMQEISTDPRLDLAEGQAAYYSSDFSRQVKATSKAIEKAEARGLDSLASEGLLSRGNAFLSQGALEKALEDFERAEKLAGDNLRQVALVRNSVAGALAQQGKLNQALRWYGKARDAYLKLDDQKGANEQSFYLAAIHEEQGKLQLARQEYEAALRQPGSISQHDEGLARGSLGSILAHQGHLIEAAESLEAAIAIFKDMGDKEQEAGYLCRLSRVHLDNLALKPAKASWQRCFDVARSRRNSPLEADALSMQGFLSLFQNDLERALRSQQSAKELYQSTGNSFGVALKQLALAEIELERGQAASARSQVQAALDYFYDQRALNEMARAKVFLARSFLLQGMPQRAQTLIEEARRRVAESGSLVLRIQVSLVEARALAAMGNVPEARKIIQRELNDHRNLGYPKLRMETRLAQGEIEALHGDRNQGRELLSLVEEDARERGFKLVEAKAARLRARS